MRLCTSLRTAVLAPSRPTLTLPVMVLARRSRHFRSHRCCRLRRGCPPGRGCLAAGCRHRGRPKTVFLFINQSLARGSLPYSKHKMSRNSGEIIFRSFSFGPVSVGTIQSTVYQSFQPDLLLIFYQDTGGNQPYSHCYSVAPTNGDYIIMNTTTII